MKRQSLFFRLVINHIAVIIFITVTLMGFVMYYQYKGNMLDKEEEVARRVTNIAASFSGELKAGRIPDAREWQLVSDASGAILWLQNADGQIVRGELPPGYKPEPGSKDVLQQIKSKIHFSYDGAIVLSVPVAIGEQPGLIGAYYPFGEDHLFASIAYFYIFPFSVGVVAAIWLGIRLSRKLTRLLADITQAARRFSMGDYTSRTSTIGEDEIGVLGRTFNAMAEAILHTQETRRDFFANVSHELKTPLSCVKVTTEALLDGMAENEEEQHHYLQRILDETNRMSRLVYDIMDSEQLESGKMRIKQEKIDLAALLRRQADKIEPQLHKRNVSINLQICTDKHYVTGDRGRFEQVLDNLTSNAIRYAPDHSTIGLSLTKKNNYLELCVSDQGTGIAEEDQPLIWERFYRTDKSRNRSSGGSGLGLSISRGLMEAMGGTIAVESEEGKGSIFKIRLPWQK